MKHILSINQFASSKQTDPVFELAKYYKSLPPGSYPSTLKGRILATIFFEPSTRTRLSFESAVLRLGGSILGTENANEFLSAHKGESLEDTIRILSGYADGIILRHNESGALSEAAKVSLVPIINAGDGSGEHPTQALLDLFTIHEKFGGFDGLCIGLAGDVAHSRTIHSLIYALADYDVELVFVAPEGLELPEKDRDYLRDHKTKYSETTNMESVMPRLNVLYINRPQSERHATKQATTLFPRIDESNVGLLTTDSIIMNPLPRVGEIAKEIDSNHRSVYFEQARNGLFIRMALLDMLYS